MSVYQNLLIGELGTTIKNEGNTNIWGGYVCTFVCVLVGWDSEGGDSVPITETDSRFMNQTQGSNLGPLDSSVSPLGRVL